MRNLHDRLCELEDKRSKADRCRALYEYHNFGTLPDDPRFAAEVRYRHGRTMALLAEMEASIPSCHEDEHPDATARRVSDR